MYYFTNGEIAKKLAESIRQWRLSPRGAGMTQAELSLKSGMGLTPLKRFEKTGAITLRNLIAIMRVMDLLYLLEHLIPDPETPGPLEKLAAQQERLKKTRKRAAKTVKEGE